MVDVNELMTDHGLSREEALEVVRRLKGEDLESWTLFNKSFWGWGQVDRCFF